MLPTIDTFNDALVEPRWLRDFARFVPLKSQFVLTGNIRDLHPQQVGAIVTTASLQTVLTSKLSSFGYAAVLTYDPVAGFRAGDRADGQPAVGDQIFTRLGVGSNGDAAAGLDIFGSALDRLVNLDGPPVALIANFASRLIVRSDALAPLEHQLFTRALVLSQSAQARPTGPSRTPLFNCVIWIVDKEGDLPDWLTIDNPRVRHIPISPPDRGVRRALVPHLVRGLPGAKQASPKDLHKAQQEFLDGTEGMLLVDLNAIVQLARSESITLQEIGEAVRRFKVGVTEDAWKKIERDKVRNGAATLGRRIIGQDHAITHMLDIVKRAVTGVAGPRRGGRPRGVAFLAGPTGVGKTELAKAVTELLFGDETAYIRFDMSEFSAEHSDQRLIGAPPGYVGYDVGGELTNAIRDKPFSVVLFDEIEKAHPRILDKFLQILDDGVLTSGRGDRVYFSEALIIFTSNLGIYSSDGSGGRIANVTTDQPFPEVQSRVRSEIDRYFKTVLNRPEILNRFGENIIVFDFIRSAIADRIFGSMVERILADASDGSYSIGISSSARETLRALCVADLTNGGRGIRNKLEVHLINPLARALFERPGPGSFTITGVESGTITSLSLESRS